VGGRLSALCLVTLGAVIAPVAPALAAFPGTNGKIAFNADRGISEEIYVMNADGTGQTALTSNTAADIQPAWSPDGSRIAFASNRDGDYEIYAMQSDGSGQTRLTSDPADDLQPAWSADGTRIAFTRIDAFPHIQVVDADGSDEVVLISEAREPAWSADGARLAFSRGGDIWVASADGTGAVNVTPEDFPNFIGANMNPGWSPSGHKIAFAHDSCEGNCGDGMFPQWEIWTVEPDGAALGFLSGGGAAVQPAWSPDGTRIAVNMGGCPYPVGTGPCDPPDIGTMPAGGGTKTNLTNDQLGSNPDWQPVPYIGYPRPKSANPVQVSLVPAYEQCTASNLTHGPPLGFASCNPPAQTSSYLTVGTPDANGAAPGSTGYARLKVFLGVPGPPHDTQAFFYLNLTDVRCTALAQACGSANAHGGADYAGELEARVTFRMTDANNAVGPGGGPDRATMTDYTFQLPMSSACTATADTAIGATCNRTFNLAGVIPGSVPEGKRAIWEMEQVRVYDGGADGDAATPADNQLFAKQGIFVP
jgi:Tol biopolymer transport system component